MVVQESFHIDTRQGRGTYEITWEVEAVVRRAGMQTGLCQVFVHHTSASLVISENADPVVRDDMERFMRRLVPDGDRLFEHTAEGPDDMPAHIRAFLTKMDLCVPVTDGCLALGTWQGIYLWEHRTRRHRRRVSVTVIG
jgi:secondary thiamine-phosphate synthase enzyme